MEQPVARFMSNPPDARMEDDGFVYFTHTQPPSEHSTLPLASWDGGNRESMESFHRTLMSMGWPQQIPTTTPSPIDVTRAASPSMAAHQYIPPSTAWLQPTSFGGGSIGSGSFESGVSRFDSAPWDPGAYAASTDAQTAVGAYPPQDEAASYPLGPLKPESGSTLLPTNWQHDERGALPEHQPFLASEYDFRQDRERGAQATGGKDETQRRKRGRLPIQTQYLDADPERYMPPPLLRRDSASDTSYSTSPPASGTTQTFDTADAYHLRGGASDTTGSPPRPSSTTITQNPPSHQPTNPSPRSPPDTAATPRSPNPKKKPTIQARNRAAASRYRAKTQAVFAQLEAEERDASVRNQTLLASAGQLRDEVFQLKNELLRHADCECPLIRGYLERAAERACLGLRG